MRVYVTGSTGYIGTALVRRLVADGHEVRALVRETSRTDVLDELGVATFPGDITDRYSMRPGMSGCDWVLHLAAELDPTASLERMRRINVEGSDAVASLAYKLGVGRMLSVSSIAYWGGSPGDGTHATEETPPQEPYPTAYSLTKHEGELAVRTWEERGLRVVTVYPSLVYGPPGKKMGANWLLRALLKERFPVLVGADRLASWVYLDDVVEAIVRVVRRADAGDPHPTGQVDRGGEPGPLDGRGYLLAGDVITVRELADRVAELGGSKAPRWNLSPGVARAATAVTAPLFRMVGKNPPLPPEQLASLSRHWAFDDSRAREELDWSPRPLSEGLPPTIEYLKAEG